MRNHKPRSNPFFRSIMAAFLAAAMSGEAVHYHEEHNPHGNRRERIEEARQRAAETERHRNARRNFNAGGNPEQPLEREIQALIRRRRDSRPGARQEREI